MSKREKAGNNGYRCPECGSHRAMCYESRFSPKYGYRRRRRECEACGHRFSTYEVLMED